MLNSIYNITYSVLHFSYYVHLFINSCALDTLESKFDPAHGILDKVNRSWHYFKQQTDDVETE